MHNGRISVREYLLICTLREDRGDRPVFHTYQNQTIAAVYEYWKPP
jgi:hypothetical protein